MFVYEGRFIQQD